MRLLGICGRKQSGKSSSCNYVMGLEMERLDIIDRFDIADDGKLLVNHAGFIDDDGNEVPPGVGPFDFERRDPQFISYCSQVVWPHAKIFSFAESLKWIAVNMMKISPEKIYGTDDEKNGFTQYSWEDLKDVVPGKLWPKRLKTETKKLTGRQFLQLFGDVLRWINDSAFIDVTIDKIQELSIPLSLISDCRRVDEAKRIRAIGGKTIFLTKQIAGKDTHRTEREFDNVNLEETFDYVVDNQNMTIHEKNVEINKILRECGWI